MDVCGFFSSPWQAGNGGLQIKSSLRRGGLFGQVLKIDLAVTPLSKGWGRRHVSVPLGRYYSRCVCIAENTIVPRDQLNVVLAEPSISSPSLPFGPKGALGAPVDRLCITHTHTAEPPEDLLKPHRSLPCGNYLQKDSSRTSAGQHRRNCAVAVSRGLGSVFWEWRLALTLVSTRLKKMPHTPIVGQGQCLTRSARRPSGVLNGDGRIVYCKVAIDTRESMAG